MLTQSQPDMAAYRHCFLVLRGGSDGLIPVRGEDAFNVAVVALLRAIFTM